jgi:hypothetical protein
MTDEKPVTPEEPTTPNTDEVVFTEPVAPAEHVETAEPVDAEPVAAEPVTVASVDDVADPVVEEEPPALVEPPASAAEPVVETPVYREPALDGPVETVEAPAETSDIDNTAVLVPEGVVAAAPATVYVAAPVPPRYRGNRGFGVLIAIVATVIFAAVLALVLAIIDAAKGLPFAFDFILQADFYYPVAFFLVGFVILVLIVNRGSWWAYILGSIFVALFVYFGFVGAELLKNTVFSLTPSEAGRLTARLLGSPTVIAAGLIAREVSMWTGSAISARGRRVKARNVEARRAHEAELEARRAEYGNAA